MRKFIIKTCLFIIPIIALSFPLDLLLSNAISKCSSTSFVADEYSVWNDILEKEIDSDIAIYGSSRAWVHFNSNLLTDSLGHDSYNFGVDGHNFWIQYLRHKIYIENNRRPKVIILSVDYSTLQKREDLFNYNQFLPYMLWNEDIKEYTSDYIGFQNLDFKIPLLRYVGKFNFFLDALALQFKNEEAVQRRDKGFAGVELTWQNDLEEAKKKNKSYKVILDDASIELFDTFLMECDKNDITVLMVHAPIYYEGLQYIENNEEVLEVLRSFSKKHSLDFLDYSKDKICYDKSRFYNATHLNKEGANIFTNKLIQDIRNTKAIQRLNRQ